MSAGAGTDGTGDGGPPPPKKDDPLAGVKAALDAQMRRPPYSRFSGDYDGEEFAHAKFAALVPWGTDQTFSGLTRPSQLGSQTPHGWGVLEHHEGFIQACSMWRDGVADGPGMWAMSATGQEQCGYGTWVQGVRDGYFALVKEGGVYIDEYVQGDLKRRIKWRRDKLHILCSRCNTLFVPSANGAAEKFCRFHLKRVEADGRYPCCGALETLNPRGCTTSMHVEPDQFNDQTQLESNLCAAAAELNINADGHTYPRKV